MRIAIKKDFLNSFKGIILAVLAFAVVGVAIGYSEPDSAPPQSGNKEFIHTGSNGQIKNFGNGGISLIPDPGNSSKPYLKVEGTHRNDGLLVTGGSIFEGLANFKEAVVIGTTIAPKNLLVNGKISVGDATGPSKLNVDGTIQSEALAHGGNGNIGLCADGDGRIVLCNASLTGNGVSLVSFDNQCQYVEVDVHAGVTGGQGPYTYQWSVTPGAAASPGFGAVTYVGALNSTSGPNNTIRLPRRLSGHGTQQYVIGVTVTDANNNSVTSPSHTANVNEFVANLFPGQDPCTQ